VRESHEKTSLRWVFIITSIPLRWWKPTSVKTGGGQERARNLLEEEEEKKKEEKKEE